MMFDQWGLGYTRKGGTLLCHYPKRDADGITRYRGGFPFDHRPEVERTPTSERAVLWTSLLEASS